jgi:hypothetical protein
MTTHGRIRNGTIVLDTPLGLPEGTHVEVEVTQVRRSVRDRTRRDVSALIDGVRYDFDALDHLREASKL